MSNDRRQFLRGGALTALGLLSARGVAGEAGDFRPERHRRGQQEGLQEGHREGHPDGHPAARSSPRGRSPTDSSGQPPVEVPDVPKLPHRVVGGVKEFHLVAEPVRREFLPDRPFDVWGYNGSMPGPTIEVQQGDRVRFVVENRLPEITSMHWHGLELPVEMDGVPGVTQDPIPPGGTFTYEFDVHQAGTFFYHSHMPMQEMMGMLGLFIIHPRDPWRPRVDKDFGLMFQEWAILPNNTVPNSMSMEFNWLTVNGKAGPDTTPLIVRLGDRVRIRMVNLGMDHHPIHLHGNTFTVTGTEAGRAPESSWRPENTVLLGVAQARDVEFEARYPGDWMLHCHLPHHMMNHMASMVGPMAEAGHGMHSGGGMEQGMGMSSGAALSDDNGPAMGRAIGPATRERPVNHLVGSRQGASLAGGDPGAEAAGHGTAAAGQHGQHGQHPAAATDRGHPRMQGRVPGFPQDMFMTMDEMVAKPETYGLRPTWSGGVMGMMTLVRVLEPDLYDEVRRRQAAARAQA